MSIASPRPSGIASPTSSRSSLSIDRTAQGSGPRRNRTALRDYYNIKTSTAAADSPSQSSETLVQDQSSVSEQDLDHDTIPQNSELDKPDFSASTYISSLLASTSLEGILQVESRLISDIRGFDGERKALVYDNYSKLISATETISRMRTEMDPLAPTVMEKLGPAVERIAELAGEVSKGLVGHSSGEPSSTNMDAGVGSDTAREDCEKKMNTVIWVLDAPKRFRAMVEDGKKAEAEEEWKDVNNLLEKWKGVKGAGEVRDRALQALEED